MRQCVFCPNQANSKEHVLSKRILKRMGIESRDVTVGALTESHGYEHRRPYPVLAFETRRVCTECNSGWMSQLEGFVEDCLGVLLEPMWPPSDLRSLSVVTNNMTDLVRWLAKTACIVQCAGILPKEVIHAGLMKQVPTLSVSKSMHVLAAFIRERNLDVRLEKGFRVWEHGTLYANREHKEGYSFAIQMNQSFRASASDLSRLGTTFYHALRGISFKASHSSFDGRNGSGRGTAHV